MSWDKWDNILQCYESMPQMNYVRDIQSMYQRICRNGCMWMEILLDELFSILHEAAVNKQTWNCLSKPNYVAKAIANGPYPHEYLFCHVTDKQRHPNPRILSFVSYYEYNTDLRTTPKRLRKFDLVNVDLYHPEDEDHASATLLCIVADRIIVTKTHLENLSIKCIYFCGW